MIPLEQGTQAWLDWRHKGIGASDVPIIMGVSPYKKIYTLWSEKILDKPPAQNSNFIQEKGNRLEPIARAKAEIQLGKSFKPALIENDKYPFLKCSLDGLSEDKLSFMEIKYVGDNFHNTIPDKYFPQVQYQYALTGATLCYYVQINNAEEIKILEIGIDVDYIKEKMFPAVKSFWDMVQTKVFKIAPKLELALNEYAKLQAEADRLEERLKELKEIINEETPDKFSYGKFTIFTTHKKGTVKYADIVKEKLPDLDLTPWMGKGSSSKTIKINKD